MVRQPKGESAGGGRGAHLAACQIGRAAGRQTDAGVLSVLIVLAGAMPSAQFVPVRTEQRGGIFAIAGIRGPFASPLDAKLGQKLLDPLWGITCGKLPQERLEVFGLKGLGHAWPTAHQMPWIVG